MCAHTDIFYFVIFSPHTLTAWTLCILLNMLPGHDFLKELCSFPLQDKCQGSKEQRTLGGCTWGGCELSSADGSGTFLPGVGGRAVWPLEGTMFPKFLCKQEILASPSYPPSFCFLRLTLILKIFALGHLEAPEDWCLGVGPFRVWVLGPVRKDCVSQTGLAALSIEFSLPNTSSYQQMALWASGSA